MKKSESPFEPSRDTGKTAVVYSDGVYTLGQQDGEAYLIAKGERYSLTCHPYEPCLYITDRSGFKTAVHNAFDPGAVLEIFSEGGMLSSITGRTYGARDFCRIVEYAAGMGDVGIDDAERVLGGRRTEEPDTPKEPAETDPEERDPFCELIADYPDLAVEYSIVKNDFRDPETGEPLPYGGAETHRRALERACRRLFDGWEYDIDRARAKKTDASALFTSEYREDALSYRKAFLYPPHGHGYTGKDFAKVNAVLFPNGTEYLEVYEWTTDWSEYFDDGHEWWGALCLTVYDRGLGRFAVIVASATD